MRLASRRCSIPAVKAYNKPMPTRRRIRLELILASLFTTCTDCGRPISPAELRFVDGLQIRCPQCRTLFEPTKKGIAPAA